MKFFEVTEKTMLGWIFTCTFLIVLYLYIHLASYLKAILEEVRKQREILESISYDTDIINPTNQANRREAEAKERNNR